MLLTLADWETAIKSIKTHLRRIVGTTPLTFEKLLTVLTQIEACLNSHPLCPLSSDPHDLQALTPGHFLIGESLKALSQKIVTTPLINHLDCWTLLQQLVQHFWRRWSTEYLHNLQ